MGAEQLFTDHEVSRAKAHRKLALVIAGLMGGGVAFVVVILVIAILNRQDSPAVTPSALSAASRLWDATGPDNYDLEVKLTTRQTELHRVEVRDGVVRAYSRNGRPMTRYRTFGTWSVPGMFATIERDVANVKRFEEGTAEPNCPKLTLWGTFDADYGYPKKYHRIEWGSDVEVSWEVTQFKVVNE